MMQELLTRLRFFLFRRKHADLEEELKFHLEQSTEAKVASGMSPAEARRQALIEFGGVEAARERSHEQRPGWWLDTSMQDVRYALRGFRRNPVFAITVIATLALGIGATTATFSVVDRILFRSLPYAHDDELVSVGLVAPILPQEFMLGGSYYDWRDNQTPFAAFTSETGVSECDLTERNPVRLNCARVEASFLPTLGVAPILGRNFLPEEDRPKGPKAALISFGLWAGRYHRDPEVAGKLIDLDGVPVRIAGVLPRDFEMPTMEAVDLLVPQALDEGAQRKAEPGRVMYAFARLKPGMSIEKAQAALEPLFQYSLSLTPPLFRKEVHLRVRPVRDRGIHDVRLVAWTLLGAVFAVLSIACANVTGLFSARGESRGREFAVRSALGATRGRLVRQALTESLLLSCAGAAAGGIVAEVLLRAFLAIAPAGIPFLDRARLDLRIILFTITLALLSGAVSGMISALQRPRADALTGRSLQPDVRLREAALHEWNGRTGDLALGHSGIFSLPRYTYGERARFHGGRAGIARTSPGSQPIAGLSSIWQRRPDREAGAADDECAVVQGGRCCCECEECRPCGRGGSGVLPASPQLERGLGPGGLGRRCGVKNVAAGEDDGTLGSFTGRHNRPEDPSRY